MMPIAIFPLLLAAAPVAPPVEPLLEALRAAIWDDLQLNGMIGNGNEVAALWLNFWTVGEAPTLHIVDLVCRGGDSLQSCRFDMLRDGGAIVVDRRTIPDRIRCSARIRRYGGSDGEWAIPHLPPRPGGGHSRTTLRCAWTEPFAAERRLSVRQVMENAEALDGREIVVSGWIEHCLPRSCVLHASRNEARRDQSRYRLSIGGSSWFDDFARRRAPGRVTLRARFDAACVTDPAERVIAVCADRVRSLDPIAIVG